MGADLTTLSGLEKEVYEKSISVGLNNSFDLKDWFKTEQADYNGGAGHVWNHKHGRNSSPFFGNEDGAYPVAGNQNSSKGNIKVKKILGRIRMTEEAMEDLVSSEASFRNGMTDEKEGLINDISRRENHSLGMDGVEFWPWLTRVHPARSSSWMLRATWPATTSATASSTSGCFWRSSIRRRVRFVTPPSNR